MYGACLFVFLDPASHMLVHERLHLCGPSFHARTGGFAVHQGEDELDAVAAGDVKDPGFPGVECGDSGAAGDRFVLARLFQ